ncbi:MAG: NYN domain-containing protein [Phycisphaerales bacterium]|nr:NYN domain-containing protein [Phycisphaerales bacterium]
MTVLIDGNNLLHAARDIDPSDLLIGRSMLCDILGSWGERRRERVCIVFDGPAPTAPLAEQIGHVALQVVFSGGGVSADDVLNRIIAADSAPRRLTVVSTDREVGQAGRRRGSRVMRSDAFWRQVRRDLARPLSTPRVEPVEKEAGLDPQATQEWLREFGVADPPEDDPLAGR